MVDGPEGVAARDEAARRGMARLEAAVAALPADELDAIRSVAADGGEDEVTGFGPDPVGDLFAAMLAYQKLVASEAKKKPKWP